MKSTPMISCTRVSKNGRRAGTSKPRRLAMARPMTMAEIARRRRGDVASGRHGDHRRKLGGGAEHLTEPEFTQQ